MGSDQADQPPDVAADIALDPVEDTQLSDSVVFQVVLPVGAPVSEVSKYSWLVPVLSTQVPMVMFVVGPDVTVPSVVTVVTVFV